MKLKDIIASRYSLRHYLSTPVEESKLLTILEAAQMAPSAVNYQPWCFIIVQKEENCNKLRACYDRNWFKSSPMYIIACANHSESWKRADGKDHADIDVSIAIEHICLTATELGLGTCWVCNFDVEKCKIDFNMPENIEPIAIIPLGYPDPNRSATEKKRKSLNDIVKYERY